MTIPPFETVAAYVYAEQSFDRMELAKDRASWIRNLTDEAAHQITMAAAQHFVMERIEASDDDPAPRTTYCFSLGIVSKSAVWDRVKARREAFRTGMLTGVEILERLRDSETSDVAVAAFRTAIRHLKDAADRLAPLVDDPEITAIGPKE